LESGRRTKFRNGLSPLFIPFYNLLCDRLGDEWQPYMGFRTMEQQEALYAHGRTVPGEIVTHAHGPESAHCYGVAADFTLIKDNEPVWLLASNPLWNSFDSIAESVGLRSGVLYSDPGHVELKLSVSYHLDIARVFTEYGMDAAMKRIAETMIK